MIPKFPEFKKLELSDQKDIEAITSKFPPYSDFDFGNLLCWYGEKEVEISVLNNNLVVIFPDFITGNKWFSFLGNDKVNQTIKILLNYIQSLGIYEPELRLIPEDSLKGVSMEDYIIEIDFDNSDYVYNLGELSFYSESKYSKKRQFANLFISRNPNTQVKLLDINDLNVQNQILMLYDVWSGHKKGAGDNSYIQKEHESIHRFIHYSLENVMCVGVFVNLELVGYSVFRKLHNGYAICYYAKTNTQYQGLNEFLMKMSASKLILEGCEWLNYEEDMGLPGLRFSKNSFRPSHFLRKYTIKKH